MRRSASFVPAVLLLAAIGLGGCSRGAGAGPGGPGGEMPPPDVGVIRAQSSSVPLQQDLVGRLAPYRSADVRARVAGVLQRRVYAEGSDVRKGQVLFLIDPAPLQAALEQSQAALAQAQASYANAHAAAARARQLAPAQFISRTDLDNALAAERSTAAAVQAGKAALDGTRINLGYATVRSPIDGRAGNQQVTEGALVGQGAATLLTTVDQIDPLYVNFSISVSELQQVRSLQPGDAGQSEVQLLLPDGTAYAHKGVLDFSGDVVDPATGAVTMRARIPNPDKALLPGTYVTLKATLGQLSNAFLIPQAAVQRDASSAFVLVVGHDGMVARQDIEAEHSQGSNWIVTKGLSSGEQVIVSGLQKAQPGKPAKPSPWRADDTPPAAAGKPGAVGQAGAAVSKG